MNMSGIISGVLVHNMSDPDGNGSGSCGGRINVVRSRWYGSDISRAHRHLGTQERVGSFGFFIYSWVSC